MEYSTTAAVAVLVVAMISPIAAQTGFLELDVCPPHFGENTTVCDGGAVCQVVDSTNDSDLTLSVLCFDMILLRAVRCNVSREDFCRRQVVCTDYGVNQCDVACPSHYRCRDSDKCAARSTLCDDQQCAGCRYETVGPGFKCVRNGRRCNIPSALVRDGVRDCDGGEDEQALSSYFVCNDKSLISKQSVCDGTKDCPDLSDECLCPDANAALCRYLNPQLDSAPQQDALDSCPVQEPCTEPSEIFDRTTDKPKVCKLSRDYNYTTVPRCEACNYRIVCFDGADEMNCTDGRHYCESGSPPYVRPYQINDGRMDCSDGSDECQVENGVNTMIFHSRYAMIGNTFLFVLVWLILIFALVGNGIVLVQEARTLCAMRHQMDVLASLRANHVLVLNLTLANFLMIAYLVCLGVAYERLRGVYCQEELSWRSSSLCTWMGALVVVSTETSVQTLLLLTVVRFNSVLRPYKVTSQPPLRLLVPLVVLVWTISVVLAWLPLSHMYRSAVQDGAWIPGNPFLDSADANITSAKNFLYRYSAYTAWGNSTGREATNERISAAGHWSELQAINRELTGKDAYLTLRAKFTYYGTHSVCIPNMFPTSANPHWILSLAITNFNFASFVLITALYIIVYVKTGKRFAEGQFKTDAVNMQWKVFRLTASNFCCWVPIYVLAYVALSGAAIHGDVYVVAAIVLLPMNSAVSPLLYSSAIPRTFNYALGWYKHLNSRPRRKSVELSEL